VPTFEQRIDGRRHHLDAEDERLVVGNPATAASCCDAHRRILRTETMQRAVVDDAQIACLGGVAGVRRLFDGVHQLFDELRAPTGGHAVNEVIGRFTSGGEPRLRGFGDRFVHRYR
jgi:hypothetical protein